MVLCIYDYGIDLSTCVEKNYSFQKSLETTVNNFEELNDNNEELIALEDELGK